MVGFPERLLVNDMGLFQELYEGNTPRPRAADDVFSATPSARPSCFRNNFARWVRRSPTENDITGSNYFDDAVDDQYEEDDNDFIGEGETVPMVHRERKSGKVALP